MYIAPDTNIWILRGCPLDAGYENSIIFDDAAKQRAWFTEFEILALAAYSYQRAGLNTLRVGVPISRIYDANYLIFQNSAYMDKYFYAFIERVEYINDNVTEIQYKLDVMQTWLFDYRLGASFIERQHVPDDTIGANTVPENLETGEYICENAPFEADDVLLANYTPVFISSVNLANADFPQVYGRYIDGLFTGCGLFYYYGFTTISGALPAGMRATLVSLDEAGKGSAILGIIMIPTALLPAGVLNSWTEITEFKSWIKIIDSSALYGSVDGYTPKNNKCFTFPFYKLVVSNNSGKTQEFALELLNSYEFNGKMAASPASPYLIYPTDYAGKSIECALSMDGVAQCTWNNDTYKNWLAQNQSTLIVNTVSSVASAALSTALNPASLPSSVLSLATNVATTLAQLKDRQAVPMATNGTIAGATFLTSQGLYYPNFLIAHMRAEYAKIVDDYFTRFGYAIHRVDVPNREAREHFTYLKTAGCTITAIYESGDLQRSVPAEVETQLMNIYNKGVTIWRNVNGEEFGNFSISNTPTEV